MAKKKNVEELYKGIFSIREMLQDAVQLAAEIVTMSQTFGGEIPRVLTEQLSKYFIPEITKFIDNDETPGAMSPLVTFLDSVPLAMTRQDPQIQNIPPFQVGDSGLTLPPATEPVSGSYADKVKEKKMRESSKLLVGFDMMDTDPSTGKPLYDSITQYLDAKRASWEEERPDYSGEPSKSTLPEFDYVNLEVTFRAEDQAVKFVNWIRKNYKDVLIERYNRKKETTIEQPIPSLTVSLNRWAVTPGNKGTFLYETLTEANPVYEENTFEEDLLPWEESTDIRFIFPNFKELKEFSRFVKNLKANGAAVRIIQEAKEETKAPEMFAVYRKNTGGSTIGKQENIEDFLVSTYACKEDAERKVEVMNKSITPEEKQFFKTEYYVKPLEVEETKEPEGASPKVDYKK